MLKDCKEGMTFVNFNYDLTYVLSIYLIPTNVGLYLILLGFDPNCRTLFVATSEEVKVFRLEDFKKIFEISTRFFGLPYFKITSHIE